MAGMVHPTLEKPEDVYPGYYISAANANNQTTEEFIILEPIRFASPHTSDEDFIPLKPTRDASIQTTDVDFILLEPTRDESTQTSDEDFILLEPTRDANIQTTEEDFIPFEPTRDSRNLSAESSIESIGNNSNSVSKTPADHREIKFLILHSYYNDCCSEKSHLPNFSSSIEVPRNFDTKHGSRNHPVPNDTQIDKIHERNKEKNALNHEGITYNSLPHRLLGRKIRGTSGQLISTKSLHGGMGYDLAMVNQMTLDNHCSDGVHQESLNSVQNNRGMKIFGNFRRGRLFAVSSYKDVLNMDISQRVQNKIAPCKISDSKACVENMHSVIDVSTVQGPSGLPENKNISNMCEKKFKSQFPVLKSELSEKKKRLICWICNKKYTKHVIGKNFYKCCVCRYISKVESDLQEHTHNHGPEPSLVRYAEKDLWRKVRMTVTKCVRGVLNNPYAKLS